jgi:hypothetical protein
MRTNLIGNMVKLNLVVRKAKNKNAEGYLRMRKPLKVMEKYLVDELGYTRTEAIGLHCLCWNSLVRHWESKQ